MSDEVRSIEAVREMRARGIDDAESLLEYAEPAAIVRACRKWDTRTGVGKGLLVRWILDGGVKEDEQEEAPRLNVRQRLEARFADYEQRFPEGSIAEKHADMQRRQNEEPWCDGGLVVMAAAFPVLEARCDQCGLEAGYPARSLRVLPAGPIGQFDGWRGDSREQLQAIKAGLTGVWARKARDWCPDI